MMDTREMLTVFNKHRGDAIVVPGRGGKHWVEISTKRNRDVELGDPSMGGHGAFGMGLALAQPKQKIVLFDSDGDIQMSMGILATIGEQQPKNFYHFMLDNECYATTGGQPVPLAKTLQVSRGRARLRLSARLRLRQPRDVLHQHGAHTVRSGTRCSSRSRSIPTSRTSRSARA